MLLLLLLIIKPSQVPCVGCYNWPSYKYSTQGSEKDLLPPNLSQKLDLSQPRLLEVSPRLVSLRGVEGRNTKFGKGEGRRLLPNWLPQAETTSLNCLEPQLCVLSTLRCGPAEQSLGGPESRWLKARSRKCHPCPGPSSLTTIR